MTTIYQVIGKPESYREKEFVIEGEGYRTSLCSDALRKHLEEKGEDVELLVFVPESMLFNEDMESFCKKLDDLGVTDFEAIPVPSVGRYRYDGREAEFRGSVEVITTAIFIHFLKAKPEELVVDLSTGFNIYPVSLLEAAKRYLTYRKLERILVGEDSLSVMAMFTPPISPGVERYSVEIQPVDVKAFFSLPKANVDKIVLKCPENLRGELARINREYAEVKSEFRGIYEELTLAYNALKLNVPLALLRVARDGGLGGCRGAESFGVCGGASETL